MDPHSNKNALFFLIITPSAIFLLLHCTLFSNNSGEILRDSNSISDCRSSREHGDYVSKCAYVRQNPSCHGEGYLNYRQIFYCTAKTSPALGYVVFLVLLVLLFYLLGHTASEYFCPAVAGLSQALKLPPTIAGTTLLPFGNGVNDVLSSIISFTRSGHPDVGINGVLGGAFFICCVVEGVVSIAVSSRGVRVHRPCFVRDVVFFLFVLCCLLAVVAAGRVNLWLALCFVGLYLVYIVLVSVMQMFHGGGEKVAGDEDNALLETTVGDGSDGRRRLEKSWQWLLRRAVELPLDIPRKLTIPNVSDENWSKPLAALQATLAPILAAVLYDNGVAGFPANPFCIAAVGAGVVLGALTLTLTSDDPPAGPARLPWLVAGFTMSIVWTYILAEELVALLIAFGDILGISPSILGFTVLAWGNSVGDLISDLAMAVKGGADGAQVAVSGCYAGSLFNTLVGLGLSLVLAAWKEYPSAYGVSSGGGEVYGTVGFLIGGLVWALVVLPWRNMQLDKCLGVGLLVIYFTFFLLRLGKTMGWLGNWNGLALGS